MSDQTAKSVTTTIEGYVEALACFNDMTEVRIEFTSDKYIRLVHPLNRPAFIEKYGPPGIRVRAEIIDQCGHAVITKLKITRPLESQG